MSRCGARAPRAVLVLALLSAAGCDRPDRAPAAPTSAPAAPAISGPAGEPASPAASDLLGTWTVTGHRLPDVSAMTDAEAARWHGRTLHLAADEAISGTTRCERPTYTERTVARDSVRREFRLAPGALPALDSAGSLRLLEVSCGGTPWSEAGGRLLALSPDHALMVWDGVFFDLEPTRDFRAVGQEPGWSLEIEAAKQMRFTYDNGESTVTTPVPAMQRGRGGVRVYHAVTEANDLRVEVETTRCTDVMSGREFMAIVTVTLNRRTFRGCGEERQ